MSLSQEHISKLLLIYETGLRNMETLSKDHMIEKSIHVGINSLLFALRYSKSNHISQDEIENNELIVTSFQEVGKEFYRLINLLPDEHQDYFLRALNKEESKLLEGTYSPLSPKEWSEATTIMHVPTPEAVTPIDKKRLSEQELLIIDNVEKVLDALPPMYSKLIDHLNEFKETPNITVFKKNVNRTLTEINQQLQKELSNQPLPLEMRIHNSITSIFRLFFRLFDYLITSVTAQPKLMLDTETPFAKRITGKLHFFEYQQPEKTLPTDFFELSTQMSKCIRELEIQKQAEMDKESYGFC